MIAVYMNTQSREKQKRKLRQIDRGRGNVRTKQYSKKTQSTARVHGRRRTGLFFLLVGNYITQATYNYSQTSYHNLEYIQ